ncbi:MAG: hypothetical protein IJ599_00335 [Alphaproteobacteria bacterium]|nr:hypothetical protein [Alphaproteobacteria bacterium]
MAQGDIQAIWGSPYISAAINWDKLSNNRQQAIRSQHPEIDGVAKGIACARSDFAAVLSKTAPETHRFVNEFAIPMTALASTSSASERLKQVADKVAACMYEVADTFNRLMVPGYAAYADGGSVEEVVTSAASDVVLTYFGAKAVKLSYQGAKYVGGKLVSTLTPKKVMWGLWEDLPKVTRNGRTYAKIGKYYYTHHAVDYMMPKNFAKEFGITQEARGLPSMVIENAIKCGKRSKTFQNGEWRWMYVHENVNVITSLDSKVVVTLRKETLKK